MKRRDFLVNALKTPLALGISGVFLGGCKSSLHGQSDLVANEEILSLPSEFRLWQFYAPFTKSDLSKLKKSPDVFHKEHMRLNFEDLQKISSRISNQESDGANHRHKVNVRALFQSNENEIEVSPYLNHNNPSSHIIVFNKQDLIDLLNGKTIYLATGFHDKDHFHIAMIKPSYAGSEKFQIPKNQLIESPNGSGSHASNTQTTHIDSDGDGVVDSEDRCPNSAPNTRVWNKNHFSKTNEHYDTAVKFHGCHEGQKPL